MTKKSMPPASSSSGSADPTNDDKKDDRDDGSSSDGRVEEEDMDPVAFLLAGMTRTAIFVIKRIGLSPEVLRSFLQRKAFMRIASARPANTTTAPPSSSGSSTGAGAGTGTGRFNASFIARTYEMNQTIGGSTVTSKWSRRTFNRRRHVTHSLNWWVRIVAQKLSKAA